MAGATPFLRVLVLRTAAVRWATLLGGAGLILVAVGLSETIPALLDRRAKTREANADNDRS